MTIFLKTIEFYIKIMYNLLQTMLILFNQFDMKGREAMLESQKLINTLLFCS